MIDKAFILGNGPSRPTDIKWLDNLEGDTYGCNALYRDWEPDFLVANDWAIMVEIINSTYSGTCCFTDFEEDVASHWTTAILYINTNNGFTEFEDGVKVESIANRLVMFPSNFKHRGITQTDEQTRIMINFNFLKRKNRD